METAPQERPAPTLADHLVERLQRAKHKLTHPEETLAKLRARWQDPEFRTRTRLIAGTAVSGIQLLGVYGINSLSCQWHWFDASDDAIPLKTIQTVVTLAAMLLVAWWSFRLYTDWRATRSGEESKLVEALAARNSFLAFITLLLLVLYLLIMGIMLPTIWTLPACV